MIDTHHDALLGCEVESLLDHRMVNRTIGALFWVMHRAKEVLGVPLESRAGDNEQTAQSVVHVVGVWALLHNFWDGTAAQEHGMHLLSANDHDTKDLLWLDDALRLPRGTVEDLLWVECDCICCGIFS